jgi:hypothetical protein
MVYPGNPWRWRATLFNLNAAAINDPKFYWVLSLRCVNRDAANLKKRQVVWTGVRDFGVVAARNGCLRQAGRSTPASARLEWLAKPQAHPV